MNPPDVEELLVLNGAYIKAVKASDVGWFSQFVSEDFRCSLPDGSILDRETFLARAARPLDIVDLEVHDVEVRIFGDAGIVHARTTFRTADGQSGSGRYTDVWARHGGHWRTVAAHFTRSVG
jgi:ketosteroid isomerase-like protein